LISETKFTTTARKRIGDYLVRRSMDASSVRALTPDASTREYFRIPYAHGHTAIAAVYAESFDPQTLPFLDVTRLFVEAHLPVPTILDIDPKCGIIVQEDFGDTQLRSVLEIANDEVRENYLRESIELIARIQAATALAQERNSIASRLAFDFEKLAWELDFFRTHFFGSYLRQTLAPDTENSLREELQTVARELAVRPRVLCHRDFHSSNLMVDAQGRVRIIDYQDARMGPATYDLVSLLLDRQPAPPSVEHLRARLKFLLAERERLNLPALDFDEYAQEFDLMTVQRQLKAVGTFSYQTGVLGRGAFYEGFIAPTLQIVAQTLERMNRFSALREVILKTLS
jgi:aminoglycoside/choline kinase family phosphotransferase